MSTEIMWIVITSIICVTVFLSVTVYSGTKFGAKYSKLYYKYGHVKEEKDKDK